MDPADKIRRWREGSSPRRWEELACHQRVFTDATGESSKTGQILTPGCSVAASAAHFSPKFQRKERKASAQVVGLVLGTDFV